MRIHVYPINSAMRGAIDISTKRWGYITLHWLRRTEDGWRFSPGLCVSPNATPWGATLLLGERFARYEKRLAKLRRVLWGHGYDTDKHDPQRAESYHESYVGDLPCGQPASWVFDVLRAINFLRNPEGASVTILCDNPEATDSHEQGAVVVCAEWTGWEDLRFYGKDWAEAAMKAHAEANRSRQTAPTDPKRGTDASAS